MCRYSDNKQRVSYEFHHGKMVVSNPDNDEVYTAPIGENLLDFIDFIAS